VKNNSLNYVQPASVIGKQLREESALQKAAREVPARSTQYLSAENYHTLSFEEKGELHKGFEDRLELENTKKDLPPRPLFLQEWEVFTRTAYNIYGVCVRAVEEFFSKPFFSPRPKLLPLYAHNNDISTLQEAGDFHGTPIHGGNFEYLLKIRQTMLESSNIAASSGKSYPSLEELGVISGGEKVDEKNIIRNADYNSAGLDDSLQTVEKHNVLMDKLRNEGVDDATATKASEDGKLVWWRVAGSNKHLIFET